MNANEREWPQIKANIFYCGAPQVHEVNICGYLRLFALFAFSFSSKFFVAITNK